MALITGTSDNSITVTFDDGTTISLKRPNRAVLGQMLAATRRDPLGAADVIMAQCLDDGGKAIRDNTGYCYQVIKLTDEIFGKQACLLDWDDGHAEVLFADDLRCRLKPPTRQQYSAAQAAARVNPLRYIEDILKHCWVEGDEAIKQSPAHLLGFAEVVDELVSYTGEKLGN